MHVRIHVAGRCLSAQRKAGGVREKAASAFPGLGMHAGHRVGPPSLARVLLGLSELVYWGPTGCGLESGKTS